MNRNVTLYSFHLLVFFVFFGLANAFSQAVINNGSFENWETNTLFSAPSEWLSSPMLDGSSETVFKVTDDAADGTTSVRLVSILENDYVADGLLLLGEVGDNVSGIPWDKTVDKLHLSVKYGIEDGDAGFILLNLYKADTVFARVIHTLTASASEWTPISLPIVYAGDGTPIQPEKLFLAIVSSYPNEIPSELVGPDFNTSLYEAKSGSWLMVDNVYFTLGESPTKILPANNSFENWFDVSATDPSAWTSNNVEFFGRDDVPVTKSDAASEGSFAARLEVMDASGWPEAFMSIGDMDGGVPFTEKPQAIAFSYKYEPITGDEATVGISFEGLLEGQYQDNFGGAWHQISGSNATYKNVFLPIYWGQENTFTPQRMHLEVRAGNLLGSVLYVDNFRFVDLINTTLFVQDETNAQAIQGAQITFSSFGHPMQVDGGGRLDLQLPAGTYQYTIAAQGYNSKQGEVTVPVNGGEFTVQLTPFTPDPTLPVLTIIDNDEDKVYFEGDTFKAQIQLPSSIPAPDGTPLILSQYLYPDNEVNPETYTIFKEGTLSSTTIASNAFTITGVVGNVTKTGLIGLNVQVNLGTLVDAGTYPIIDTYAHNPDLSERGKAFVGIRLPESAGITMQPKLMDIPNLYGNSENPKNDSSIYFIKAGIGSIMFESGLNFVDSREQLNAFETAFSIMASPETGYYAEINLSQLSFLSGRPAKVTLENIPSGVTKPDIIITQTPYGIEPNDWRSDLDSESATLSEGALTFDVWGFNRYTLYFNTVNTVLNKVDDELMLGLYPNPAGDVLYISGSNALKYAAISDLKGVVVLEHNFNGTPQINLEGLKSGFYIIRIETDNGEQAVRSIMKR